MKKLYYNLGMLMFIIATVNSCKLDEPVYPTKIIPIKGYTPPDTTGDGTTDPGTDPGTDPDNPGTTKPGDYYFKGTLNGTAISWTVTDDANGWVTGSAGATSNDQGNISGSLTALISDSKEFQPQLGVEIGTFNLQANGDRSVAFNSYVKPGTWNYGVQNNPAGAKFIAITYVDSSGKLYSSSLGAQTGTIDISAVTAIAAEAGRDESLKIKLTFSCTLYPIDGTGASLSLKNAEATVRLENIL